jgi:hypothetical protein
MMAGGKTPTKEVEVFSVTLTKEGSQLFKLKTKPDFLKLFL